MQAIPNSRVNCSNNDFILSVLMVGRVSDSAFRKSERDTSGSRSLSFGTCIHDILVAPQSRGPQGVKRSSTKVPGSEGG